MKKYLFSALFLTLNAYAVEAINHLSGNYECKGHEVDTHDAFTCQMTIKQTKETYASIASCSDGTSYRGTGIYDKTTNQLSTAFINLKNPKEIGISVALLKADGSVDNRWTYFDKTTIAFTTCQKE